MHPGITDFPPPHGAGLRAQSALVVAALLFGATGTVAAAPSLPAQATPSTAPNAGPVTAPDADLLRRVVAALSSGGRRARGQAVGKLAGLSDARTVQVLTYVARHDRTAQVAVAAVRGLGALGKAGRADVVGPLGQLGRDGERANIAETALQTLGKLRSPAAFTALAGVARSEDVRSKLRKRALAVARRYFPKRSKELPRLAGSAGVAAIGGAGFGGYTMSMIGRFAATDSAETIGWVTGIALGGVAGWLVGRELPLERQAYYGSGLFWGAAVGSLLGGATHQAPVEPDGYGYASWRGGDNYSAYNQARLAYEDDRQFHERYVGGLSVAGELLAGVGLWLAADSLNMSAGDVVVTDLGGGAGFFFCLGALQQLTPRDDKRGASALLALSTLAGLGLSAWVAPQMELSAGDGWLMTLGAAEGAAWGASISGLVLSDKSSRADEKIGGSALMGMSLGLVAGGALSQVTDYQPGDVGQMMFLSQLGKALGAGSVLLADPDDDKPVLVGMLIGSGAGLLSAATVARSLSYDGGGGPLVAIGTTWGAWHGVSLAAWLDEHTSLDGTQLAGVSLLNIGVFGLGAAAAAQAWDFTGMEAAMGSTGLVWGAWLAGWTGSLRNWEAEDLLFATAIGGDVGAAISGVLVSPVVGLDPLVIGGASIGGIGLAGIGTMAMMMVTEDRDRWIQANLAGSALGLALGGMLTSWWLEDRRARRKAGIAPAMEFETPAWLRGVGATPVMDGQGRMEGMALTLQGAW